jgi:hypothetical protein
MMTEKNGQRDWTQTQDRTATPKASVGPILFIILVVGIGGALTYHQLNGGSQTLVLEKCCDDILLGPKAALFVRAKTEVRTKPGLTSGRIAYTYNRGVTVIGDIVMGDDGKTRWLKQQGDGWYVLARDLSTGAAPILTLNKAPKSMASGTPLEVRQIPKANAPIMVTLPAGTAVEAVGIEKGGFTEITFEHPTYRVGYVKAEAQQ